MAVTSPALQPSGTRKFADLDGVGVTLKAKAAQALPGILVGQVEAPLQVLSGRLLHAQLLCILLVEEANFLPKKRVKRSGKVLLPLPYSCSLSPKPTYQPVVLSHFPTSLQGKSQREDQGKGRGTAVPLPALLTRRQIPNVRCEQVSVQVGTHRHTQEVSTEHRGPEKEGGRQAAVMTGGTDHNHEHPTPMRLTGSTFSGSFLRWGKRRCVGGSKNAILHIFSLCEERGPRLSWRWPQ